MAFNYSFIGFVIYATITALYVLSHISDDSLYATKKYAKMGGFPFDSSYGGRLKFLTHIDVLIQTLFFGISALNALFGGIICKFVFSSCCKTNTNDKHTGCSLYSSLLNTFFTSIVFPIGSFVTVSFWGLYLVDKKLVYPDPLGSIIPDWQNHVMHTLPLLGVLIEQFFVQHRYPSLLKGLLPTFLFVLAYGGWVIHIGTDSGKWVYPILKVLTPLNRAFFIGSQILFACFLYRFGHALSAFFHGGKSQDSSKSAASKSPDSSFKRETRSKAKKAN